MAVVPLGAMANNHKPDGLQKDFTDRVSSVKEFSDVQDANHWAYGHLSELIKTQKCVAGFRNRDTGERTFRGDQPITRYEMVALLNSCLDEQKLPKKDNQPENQPDCPDPGSTSDLENLEEVTTLVIKNNDSLKSIDFLYQQPQQPQQPEKSQAYSNLRRLVIKNNDNLVEIRPNNSRIKFHKLTSIKIDNNRRLKGLQLRPAKPELLSWPFNRKSSLVIQHNNCLGDLKLKNMNNLRELRIEGNDNLIKIIFDVQKSSNEKAPTNSGASPPETQFSTLLTS